MKAAKVIFMLVGSFIVMPIWFYLFYQVLVRVHATELMFFLFWVYVPLTIFVSILSKIIEFDK
jgi:hypothetical protein